MNADKRAEKIERETIVLASSKPKHCNASNFQESKQTILTRFRLLFQDLLLWYLAVLIEAVQNHSPQVIVVDEIGDSKVLLYSSLHFFSFLNSASLPSVPSFRPFLPFSFLPFLPPSFRLLPALLPSLASLLPSSFPPSFVFPPLFLSLSSIAWKGKRRNDQNPKKWTTKKKPRYKMEK